MRVIVSIAVVTAIVYVCLLLTQPEVAKRSLIGFSLIFGLLSFATSDKRGLLLSPANLYEEIRTRRLEVAYLHKMFGLISIIFSIAACYSVFAY
jgi:hypothetical protein